jgi:hypothetical protein
VTAEKATIWVATRFEVDATLELLQAGNPIATATRTSEPIGEHFHVLVITADVPAGTTGIVQYNLRFNTVGGPSGDLFAPFIVAETAADARRILTYDPEPFVVAPTGPSFPMPPAAIDEVRVIHGSCRKIAGDGKDAFPAVDEILSKHFGPPVSGHRPTMLVLTGDNIYTDGSDETVLKVASEIGNTLLGFDEQMPGINKRISEVVEGRAKLTLDDIGMTGARPWRAFSLGEVLGLYLLTFSDALWPPEHDIDSMGFRAGNARTRRILANIPTYMTFDDHEIGNSWNIAYDWYSSVVSKPLGRRVYQNCLAGFALCQAWGNTPEQFEAPDQPGTSFLTSLRAWIAGKGVDENRELQIRLGIPAASATPPRHLATLHSRADITDDPNPNPPPHPQIRWDFAIACGKVHLTVLDVHTWTEYGDDPFDAPRRMPIEAWTAQLVTPPADTIVAIVVVSNVAIQCPKTPQAFLQQIEWGLRSGNRDEVVKWLFLVGWGAMATFFVSMLAIQLIPEEWLIPIAIGIALALVIAAVTAGEDAHREGYLWNFPFLSALTRSSRNAYLDEVGYNFEWGSPPFERLVARLADHYGGAQDAKIVVLSGDVHESYTMRLEYWGYAPFSFPRPTTPRQVRSKAVFAQLVSSPIKYTSTKEGTKEEFPLWYFAAWSAVKPETDPVHALWWNKDPWITAFSPAGSATEPVKFDSTDPDWLYEIRAIPPQGPAPGVLNVAPSNTVPAAVDQLKKMTKERADAFLSSQRIITNSVAECTFDLAATEVTHTIWRWWLPAGGTGAQWVVSTAKVGLMTGPSPWPVPGV